MKLLTFTFHLILLVGVASAAPLCVSDTLAAYSAPAFECDFGGATWSGFTLSTGGFAISPVLTAADISVSPVTTGPGLFGFIFGGSFVALEGDEGTYSIGFNGVAPLFSNVTLLLTGVNVGPAVDSLNPLASVTKIVRTAPGGSLLTIPPFPTLEFGPGTVGGSGTITVPFVFPSSTINVAETLTLRGAASAELLANKFLISDIPEPASFLLLGSGLVSLTVLIRRKRRSPFK